MVNSSSDNGISGCSRLRSKNELTPTKPLRYENADEKSSKYNNLHTRPSKTETSKSITKINTITDKTRVETKKNRIEDNIFQLRELKLNITRIDETNYISMFSPRTAKMIEENSQNNKQLSTSCVETTPKKNLRKSLRWNEHNENNAINSEHNMINSDDEDQLFDTPKKCSLKNSASSSNSINLIDVPNTLESVTQKCTQKTSVSISSKSQANIILESITPKRTRKSVSQNGELVDLNNTEVQNTPRSRRTKKPINRFGEPVGNYEIEIESTPPKNKYTRKASIPLPSSGLSNDEEFTLESVTPKRTRKSVNRNCKSVDLNDTEIQNTPRSGRTKKTTDRFGEPVGIHEIEIESTPPKNKHTRKAIISLICSSHSDDEKITLESVTPKRTRKSVSRNCKSVDLNDTEIQNTPRSGRTKKTIDRFGEPVGIHEIEIESTPPKNKHTRKASLSFLCSSPSDDGEFTLESVTPKRRRKSVGRNDIEIQNTPKSNKKSRKMSVNGKDEDLDSEINDWKTPVNKHIRQSMTPTTYSGSKVRRSILQDIPENKEIVVVTTPKTPRKTPKTHVKNLIASANKRLDSGVKVPCSPLEKARASLHLHAAPKHLPCREVEFKSIHSFLARKIHDELTGSMYISGVPGTGKTATVKRVIDSLNTDLIMKHSFKFIEINGLRLANPHQAFSVIWKELTAETVSSSRAQALLDDYFSGKEVRELSTILLVDEVDHICNRKQDVVYNILDWPSRTGSKVVVITIANTMDLPERVLRGCVTSRMGLTRLVFKPYTFQQLQEIIMNRLIGNSSFDPDAVQLVARKVAAVSGDARRALDICRRAIDLIKSDDDAQLITINHVNQVLNSILSGVRVTAIRYCSLFEQFFLRALRDETIKTGFDHSTIYSVHIQMKSICLLEGEELPNDQQVVMMAYRLRDSGLIFLEKKRWDVFRKVSLNVSPEDITYALDKYNI